MHYGLESVGQLKTIAAKVTSVFGGGHVATTALLEICATETHMGQLPDRHPERLGVGVTQFDQIGLDDLQARVRGKDRARLKEFFGYDLGTIVLADLAYDPVLALCCARLKYKLIADPIPVTIEGRAKYWKKWYNSAAGKGTVESYLEDCKHYMI